MNIIEELNRKKDFREKPQEYVYARYVEYVKTGQYPYLRSVAEYIVAELKKISCISEDITKQLHNLTEEQKENLHREVYLCADIYRKTEEDKHTQEMLKKGWKILTLEDVKEAFENKRKLRVISINDTILGDCETDKVYRPFINDKGDM